MLSAITSPAPNLTHYSDFDTPSTLHNTHQLLCSCHHYHVIKMNVTDSVHSELKDCVPFAKVSNTFVKSPSSTDYSLSHRVFAKGSGWWR
ncbi:hypothetical protein BKA69DRAFT_167944 [Paraphysoderma sedebokerense]|nr:hypothetical protein BKA69DRAFT_167944 [Paraphysoderma sedebokerense]